MTKDNDGMIEEQVPRVIWQWTLARRKDVNEMRFQRSDEPRTSASEVFRTGMMKMTTRRPSEESVSLSVSESPPRVSQKVLAMSDRPFIVRQPLPACVKRDRRGISLTADEAKLYRKVGSDMGNSGLQALPGCVEGARP